MVLPVPRHKRHDIVFCGVCVAQRAARWPRLSPGQVGGAKRSHGSMVLLDLASSNGRRAHTTVCSVGANVVLTRFNLGYIPGPGRMAPSPSTRISAGETCVQGHGSPVPCFR